MLDRVLEGELNIDDRLQSLLSEVVGALPNLVKSYSQPDGMDMDSVRHLTNRCFDLARASEQDLAQGLSQVDGEARKSAEVTRIPAA